MSKASTTSITDLGKPPQDVKTLSNFLGGDMKKQLQLALPKHLDADRVTRLVLTEFSKTQLLQKCTMVSIAGSVMTASQLGLEIGVGGHAYLVPYWNNNKRCYEATLVPGWKGLADLVARAGRATAWTGAVYTGDELEWSLGSDPRLFHQPRGESDPDKLEYAYAIGRIKGVEWPIIECWTAQRIRAHFKKNVIETLQDKHYANKHWEMYCRKVVLLQVLKYLPTSVEVRAAMEIAHAEDSGKRMTIDADFIPVSLDEEVQGEQQEQEQQESTLANEPDPEVPTTGAKIRPNEGIPARAK